MICDAGDPCPHPNLQPLKGGTMPGIEAPIDPPQWDEAVRTCAACGAVNEVLDEDDLCMECLDEGPRPPPDWNPENR